MRNYVHFGLLRHSEWNESGCVRNNKLLMFVSCSDQRIERRLVGSRNVSDDLDIIHIFGNSIRNETCSIPCIRYQILPGKRQYTTMKAPGGSGWQPRQDFVYPSLQPAHGER